MSFPIMVIVFMVVSAGEHTGGGGTTHLPGDRFVVRLDPLLSLFRRFVKRDYYGTPLPKPAHNAQSYSLTRLSALVHMLLRRDFTQASPFGNVRWPQTNASAGGRCQRQANGTLPLPSPLVLNSAAVAVLRVRINDRYRVGLLVDGEPCVGPDAFLKTDDALARGGITGADGIPYWYGYEIGWIAADGRLFLNNHVDIDIFVDHYGRVLHCVTNPRHVSTPCGPVTTAPTPLNNGSEAAAAAVWSYQVVVNRLDSNMYKNRWQFYERLGGVRSSIRWISFGIMLFFMLVCIVLLCYVIYRQSSPRRRSAPKTGLDVALRAITTGDGGGGGGGGVSSFDSHGKNSDDGGAVAAAAAAAAAAGDGWVDFDIVDGGGGGGGGGDFQHRVHASDVFRKPRGSLALTTLLGVGCQLNAALLLSLLLALLFTHTWNTEWQGIMVLMVPSCGCIGGAVAFYFNHRFERYSHCIIAINMVLVLPPLLVFLFVLLVSVELVYHSAAVITALAFFGAILLFVDLSSVLFGIRVVFAMMASSRARRAGGGRYAVLERMSSNSANSCLSDAEAPLVEIECAVPSRHRSSTTPSAAAAAAAVRNGALVHRTRTWVSVAWTGFLTCVCTSIPAIVITHQIIESIWATHVHQLAIVTAVFFAMRLTVVICVAIIGTLYRIDAGNHRWYWTTFLTSGSGSITVIICGIYFICTQTGPSIDDATVVILLLYVWAIAISDFMMCGAVGVVATECFLRHKYRNERVD
jgi:hypothetical protein